MLNQYCIVLIGLDNPEIFEKLYFIAQTNILKMLREFSSILYNAGVTLENRPCTLTLFYKTKANLEKRVLCFSVAKTRKCSDVSFFFCGSPYEVSHRYWYFLFITGCELLGGQLDLEDFRGFPRRCIHQ